MSNLNLNGILNERGARYGSFEDNAAVAQHLKEVLTWCDPERLTPSQREALDMIFSKISRIISGDAGYVDTWVDIAGYAQLVAKELEFQELDKAEQVIGVYKRDPSFDEMLREHVCNHLSRKLENIA